MNYCQTDNSTNPWPRRSPWNKGKLLIGPKPPFRLSHVWSMRTKLQIDRRGRGLALFNLAIESKLRNRGLVAVRVDDGSEPLHRRPSNDSAGKRVGRSGSS
jgi:hypothetical protein